MTSGLDRLRETVKLGEHLELDLRLRELRRRGRVLKLERIPMEVLLLLVEQEGKVVTRQQIVERVWGTGVALDTDNSTNGAIRKIRQALRDNSEHPRFVQTITGIGYRFIATVTRTVPERNVAAPPQELAASEVTTSRPQRRLLVLAAIVLLVGTILLAYQDWSSSKVGGTPSNKRIMLAVLPFENLTGEASQEYFSEGFTDEMITQLGSLNPHQLGVIARSSVMRYRQHPAPLDQIFRGLGVEYVLEGGIRRSSGRVLVSARLIQAKDRTQIWAQDFDRKEQDLVTLQAEIAREIADQIQLTLEDNGNATLSRHAISLSPKLYQAQDLYLKGRYFWNERTPQGFRQAVQCFQQSIASDPNYARAYAGLADSYAMMSDYGLAPPEEFMPKARTAALRALELDDRLAEAHTSLAAVAENYDYDWKTAEKEYRSALELNPSDATSHQWYAELLAYQGRFKEATAESERARQLDPLSLVIVADNGAILYFSRHYDRAIKRFRGVLGLDPSVARAYLIIGAYVQKRQFKEALAQIDTWRRYDDGPWTWAWEAYVYGRAGELLKAHYALRRLRHVLRAWNGDPAQFLDLAYAGMNDRDKWLACLQKAFREHTNVLTGLKVDPMYDPLRSDPRFQNLVRLVGLAQ